MGQKGEYYYQKTVKSIRELHQFRVENNCSFVDSVHFLNEYIMPCTGGKNGRKCAFKLMALAPDLANGTIQIYAHYRHNHPIQSNGKISSLFNRPNELVPDDTPSFYKYGKRNHPSNQQQQNIILQPKERKEGRGRKDAEKQVPTMEEQKHVDEPMEQIEQMEEKLARATAKLYKWMAGIGPTNIEGTIGDWDKLNLSKMVEMTDLEIREFPEKLNIWLPWLKCAIPKCLPQIDGFNARYKDLIKMTFE